MKNKRICLTSDERKELEQFAKKGVRSARLLARANVVLALDTSEGRKAAGQADIVRGAGVSRRTVITARDAFLNAGSVRAFLQRKKRATPPVKPKIDGQLEARVIALACSKPPEGCARWALRLLAEKCVELRYVGALSHMSVKRLLKKRNLSLT
jgi:hypothetical protein